MDIKKGLVLLILIVLVLLCNAQYSFPVCLSEDTEYSYDQKRDGVCDSRYGHTLPTHGMLRVLIVFAEIEYDLHPNMDPNPDGNSLWPIGEYPIWSNQLFDNTIPTSQCQGSITRYFHEASFGEYYVLGDYLIKGNNNNSIFKIKESEGYTYTNATNNVAETILFNKINQLMTNGIITANGFNCISYFDNWTTTRPGEAKITPSIDNDPHCFDCVVVIWRNRIKDEKNMNNTGYAGINSNLRLLGCGIDYCINVGTFSKCPTQIIRHEYAHSIIGGNNFHTAGGGKEPDYFIPFSGGWSMLGLSGSSLQSLNAWDRQRLGWKSTSNTYEISARDASGITEVNGDINISNGNNTYILRDFMTTGDAIRIKLPFIDEDREYPEWIWLENHNGKQHNNSDFDTWQYEQQNSCVENFTGGLMAYVQIDKDIRVSNTTNDVYGGYGGYTKPLSANGFYDRSFEEDSIFNSCIQWEYTHAFIKNQPNPLTGGDDEESYAYDRNHDDTLKYIDMMNNFVKKTADNNYHYHLYQLGHNSHIFTINGNKKIGIATNPSTATMMNMVRFDEPYPNNNNIRTTYLNGISMEILEQNPNGNIKVKVRFDDVDIDNDVRWCSDSIVLNEIPTSSGYSLHVKPNKTITLDQGLTATRMTNPITLTDRRYLHRLQLLQFNLMSGYILILLPVLFWETHPSFILEKVRNAPLTVWEV